MQLEQNIAERPSLRRYNRDAWVNRLPMAKKCLVPGDTRATARRPRRRVCVCGTTTRPAPFLLKQACFGFRLWKRAEVFADGVYFGVFILSVLARMPADESDDPLTPYVRAGCCACTDCKCVLSCNA
jgi:hypothetical protein